MLDQLTFQIEICKFLSPLLIFLVNIRNNRTCVLYYEIVDTHITPARQQYTIAVRKEILDIN